MTDLRLRYDYIQKKASAHNWAFAFFVNNEAEGINA